MSSRLCSKQACRRPAAATLTYVYADSTVVVGHLSERAEPHCYDMCAIHAERFTAPRGWEVVHVHQEFVDSPPSPDDIDSLARAVRQAGAVAIESESVHLPLEELEPRRGHLRVVSAPS